MANPLNVEAGFVPCAADLRELEVACRATRIAFRAIPYFAFRYGWRGVRFSDSDAGFLITLEHATPSHREHQVAWLAGVLAARGMPSNLLELHLRLLARLGTRRLRRRYDGLVSAAEMLAARRRAYLSDDAYRALASAFTCEGVPARLARGTGAMIVSAVIDQQQLAPRAVEALCGWLADPSLFGEEWCASVIVHVARARAAVAKRQRGRGTAKRG